MFGEFIGAAPGIVEDLSETHEQGSAKTAIFKVCKASDTSKAPQDYDSGQFVGTARGKLMNMSAAHCEPGCANAASMSAGDRTEAFADFSFDKCIGAVQYLFQSIQEAITKGVEDSKKGGDMQDMPVAESEYGCARTAPIRPEEQGKAVQCFSFGRFVGATEDMTEDQQVFKSVDFVGIVPRKANSIGIIYNAFPAKAEQKSEAGQEFASCQSVRAVRGRVEDMSISSQSLITVASAKAEDNSEAQKDFDIYQDVGNRDIQYKINIRQRCQCVQFRMSQTIQYKSIASKAQEISTPAHSKLQAVSSGPWIQYWHHEFLHAGSVSRRGNADPDNMCVHENAAERIMGDTFHEPTDSSVDLNVAAVREVALSEAMRGRWQLLLILLPGWHGKTASRIRYMMRNALANKIQAAWRGHVVRRVRLGRLAATLTVDHVVDKVWHSFPDHIRCKIFLLLRNRQIDALRKELKQVRPCDPISSASLKLRIEILRTDREHLANAAGMIQASWRQRYRTARKRTALKLMHTAAPVRVQKFLTHHRIQNCTDTNASKVQRNHSTLKASRSDPDLVVTCINACGPRPELPHVSARVGTRRIGITWNQFLMLD
eukprot:gnl/MRDRNA2_/MRDRNA2_28209_c0_seq1.p1 gnl/MRDRNA2_/MRDRNA2_28209_c0~~gnl/MRDRNA2_/MRDRNA2_28209_c0_seq1.p1  ORF type:complete len:601 (-),score=85.48 gnl/MRDRNA2_/MRDRNA2_28209_c0_seq1:174-1976(-)